MEIGNNPPDTVGTRSEEYLESENSNDTLNLKSRNEDLESNSGVNANPIRSIRDGYVTVAPSPVVIAMETENNENPGENDNFVNDGMYDTSSNSESDDTQIWVPTGGRGPASSLDSRSNLSSLSNQGSAEPSTPRDEFSQSPASPHRIRPVGIFKNSGMSTSLTEDSRSTTPGQASQQQYPQFSSSASYIPSIVSPIRRPQVSREDRAERVITLDSEVTSLPNGDSGIGNEDNSPGQDEAFLPDTPPPSPTNKRYDKSHRRLSYNLIFNSSIVDSLFVNLSGLYAMLLIILGTVLPISEVFTSIQRPYLFQGFYIYLYGVSVLFILFIYILVLKSSNCKRGCCYCCKKISKTEEEIVDAIEKSTSVKKYTYDNSTFTHTGSFYLRLGAVAFGIGSMIKSGLQFGIFFENDPFSGCQHLTFGFRPILHLFFTFIQLYFVFLNSKVCIQEYKLISRFGLMHLIATNICVWLENIIHETLIEIKDSSDLNYSRISQAGVYKSCNEESIMNTVVESSGPYLYPCSIEYSIICAGIIFIMWRNVGKVGDRNQKDKQWAAKMKANRLGVDCSNSSRGLFLGIFILVAVVINIIAFFVMIRIKSKSGDAVMVEHLSEIICYVMTAVAVIIAFYKMQPLGFRSQRAIDLEQTLLVIGLFGIFVFSLLSITAASFSQSKIASMLIIISSVLRMFQATLQTLFILNTLRRHSETKSHEQGKPGREFVTFLLVANIALWGINTFEVQQTEANPIQMKFYGLLPWTIFTHVSSPLAIFFRFHSTVCLANIWKHAWKRRAGHI